jgi:hypothetical protein
VYCSPGVRIQRSFFGNPGDGSNAYSMDVWFVADDGYHYMAASWCCYYGDNTAHRFQISANTANGSILQLFVDGAFQPPEMFDGGPGGGWNMDVESGPISWWFDYFAPDAGRDIGATATQGTVTNLFWGLFANPNMGWNLSIIWDGAGHPDHYLFMHTILGTESPGGVAQGVALSDPGEVTFEDLEIH